MTISFPTPSARQRLVDWGNNQDAWVRAIVQEVLDSGQDLTPDGVDRIYALLLAEKQLSREPSPTLSALTFGSETSEGSEALCLRRLSDVENVNALTPTQEVAFNQHLTVFFGENASGKSGYVRILKKLAAVRSAEDILPNIRNVGAVTGPRCQVSYTLGSDPEQVANWSGENGLPPFTRMTVFDSHSVTIHVDDALSYIYTPRDLALFSAAHHAIEGVKEKLDGARKAADPGVNPFLQGIPRETTMYPKLATLGPQTDLAELRTLGALSNDEINSIEGLRTHVEALQPRAAEARLQIVRGDRALYASILSVGEAIAGFDWNEYRESVVTAGRAAERHADATERAFAGYEIPGALSGPWTAFIQAGEEYLQHIGADALPHEKDRCLYCRQPLPAAAIELIRKYRDYCNNTVRQELDRSRAAVRTASAALTGLDLRSLENQLDRRLATIEGQNELPTLLTSALQLIRDSLPIQEALKGGQEVDASAVVPLVKSVAGAARGGVTAADELIRTLSAEASERQRALDDAVARLRELEARVRLRTILPELEKHVLRLKWGAAAGIVLTSFPAILRGVTGAAKAASEELLNQDFERLFNAECKALRAPTVKLEFPGREGQPQRKKSVSRYALSAVLSEGEQKVIALADFLAEGGLPKAVGPIVFDDPVNSLDYKRLEYVVDRIVELSKTRQIIVFTHNIWFAVELLSRCEKTPTECAYYDVSRTDDSVGIIEQGTHPRWDTVKKATATIKQLITEAEKASGEIRQALIEKGYSWVRSWCEVVVEQELLGGVTQRYQPHVRMTCLPKIKAARLEAAISVILPIFEKACRATEAHSQPLETLGIRPRLDELKKDWEALETAYDAYRQ